ncbi:MAG TPA: excinuclease ABC subunit A, partial [Kineosporiaceae bacterium]|nr:excinuclease ABC subunit A [Kineosporiaceae bacterium]
DEVMAWVSTVEDTLPEQMHPMASMIVSQLLGMAQRLDELGLGYLSLDRAGSTLSTGERQRVQLARAVRNQTTGVLYVLDEPSIGLHPSNIEGLIGVIRDLLRDGNSVVLVDHDVQVLREADWLIEIGPGSGAEGGEIIASSPLSELAGNPRSRIAGFIDGSQDTPVRTLTPASDMFALGSIHLRTAGLHTVHALELNIPKGRLIAVTGVSGSGKTTLVLESLVPALVAHANGKSLPKHVTALDAAGESRVSVVDASPIGVNVRSTVATYSGVLDDLRRVYAATPDAKRLGLKAGDFSYNTGRLRCPGCEGTGQISLDVQFLPDVDIVCPKCDGTRYSPEADHIRRRPPAADENDPGLTLPQLLAMTVGQALTRVTDLKKVQTRLRLLADLGLSYLTLAEATPALSGGEAQRLKLSSDLDRDQHNTVFVLDEPSIGLHPLDIQVLLGVLQRLVNNGATVIVIEHDLDMIRNADYLIDLGPGGGAAGGRIVATGTSAEIAATAHSSTGRYLSGKSPTRKVR